MKKFLLSAVLALPFAMNAQTLTANFDDLTLTPDSYYNGADLQGEFVSNDVHFSNSFDTTYQSWSGFAYSNMTDTQTDGFANQYSASTGIGAENSTNYAIFTPGYGAAETIDFGDSVLINSIKLTNTTYAYLSMLNGDSFAKKFGSTKNAAGENDGTNGKDFFFVRIYGLNAQNIRIDSVDYYLADFRSDTAANHYISNEWKTVNIGFGANKLTFAFFSSDNGQYGMNTPAYVAIDDVNFTKNTTGLATLSAPKISIFPNPAQTSIQIKNYTGIASIFSMNGTLVKSVELNNNTTIDIAELPAGIYQVVTAAGATRFVKE